MRWVAQPRQVEFLTATEDEVLYGGAAGGGKTDALLIDGIQTAISYPQAEILLLRKTFSDLNKPGAAIPRSHELLNGRAAWNGQDHRWTFRNGSILQFGHLQHEKDVYSYQGAQPSRLLWDELTQFLYDEFNYLRSRVRSRVPGLKPAIRGATNPGGIGHAWVKERFIDAAPPNTSHTMDLNGAPITARFIPARVTDNLELLKHDPEYPNRLLALGSELAKALLDGNWDFFAGQYFAGWRRELHVLDPIPLDQSWPRWRCIDYGTLRPFVCLWLCQDPATQRVYVYREISKPGVYPATAQAMMIHDGSSGEHYRLTTADPAMWNKDKTGSSIADDYATILGPMIPADHDRLNGWGRLREMLALAPDGLPSLQVFSTCTHLIKNLPSLVHDQHRVEDLDSDGPDDEADALRYGLMSAHWGTVTIKPQTMTLQAGRERSRREAEADSKQWWSTTPVGAKR